MADDNPTPNPDLPEKDASAYLASGFLVGGGRFSLLRELAKGGMGVVWLARDERLMASVALKFLPGAVSANPAALSDLRQETQKSRMLSHPNIIRIYDLYEAPDEAAFISMEYVDGPSLWVLRTQQPQGVFTWDYLQPIVKQLCQALDYAHGERVIHRDLKSGNMLLDERQRLRLADFGIAARDYDSPLAETGYHRTSGTLAYMSPQQIEGAQARVTDDIYALGATLYELLTGQPPFYQNDIAYQVLNVLPTPLPERLADLEVANDVPPDVAALIMACLAKDPAKRPQSALAVAESLGVTDATALPLPRFSPAVLPAPGTTGPARETKKTTAVQAPAEESDASPPVGENPTRGRFAMIAGSVGIAALTWLAWSYFIPKMPNFPAPIAAPKTNTADSTGNNDSNTAPTPAATIAPATSLNGTSVSIELGAINHENGLRQLKEVDGAVATPANIGGKECLQLETRQRARCFFQILPAYKHAGAMNARIQVEYYATAPGGMQIRYDGTTGQAPHYVNGGGKNIEGDRVWKTAYYQIDNATFKNGERGGADFCLVTSCKELYIHSITVVFEP